MTKVKNINIIRDAAEAARMLDNDDVIGFDTETTGLSPWKNSLALLQFYGKETDTLAIIQVPDGFVPDCILDLFTKNKLFIGHNVVSFDIEFLHTHGVEWWKSQWYDTLVGETVVAGFGRRDVSVSLRSSVRRRLGLDIDKDIEHGHWHEELTDEQIRYAADDVISLPALMDTQVEKAKSTNQDGALQMEMQLVPVFARMCINGLPLRRDVLIKYVEEQRVLADKAEADLRVILGDINFNSVPQLKRAFESAYGVKLRSTAKDVLQDLALTGTEIGETADKLLQYRAPRQRVKMYKEAWMDEHIVNGFVHPKFWQCGTDTGRVSSSDPNIQQVPKDGRYIFGHMEGYKVVNVDYSQIEVRIAAQIAKDAALIERLQSDDIHTAIAAEIHGISESEVTDAQRKLAKAETFTLLFGGGAPLLHSYAKRQGSNITQDETYSLVSEFFKSFQGLAAMRQRAIALAQTPGPVVIRLPNGLRRILVGANKKMTTILNTTVQGTAAVGLKYGLLEAESRGLVKDYMGATVHDEVVSLVPNKEAEEYSKELADAMETGMRRVLTAVPVKTSIGVGDWWQK